MPFAFSLCLRLWSPGLSLEVLLCSFALNSFPWIRCSREPEAVSLGAGSAFIALVLCSLAHLCFPVWAGYWERRKPRWESEDWNSGKREGWLLSERARRGRAHSGCVIFPNHLGEPNMKSAPPLLPSYWNPAFWQKVKAFPLCVLFITEHHFKWFKWAFKSRWVVRGR